MVAHEHGKRPGEPFLARGVGWRVFTRSAWRFQWPACPTPPPDNGGNA
jgi:hypothetical protein